MGYDVGIVSARLLLYRYRIPTTRNFCGNQYFWRIEIKPYYGTAPEEEEMTNFRIFTALLLIQVMPLIAQTYVSQAPNAVRAERLTDKEIADRAALQHKLADAQDALKEFENVIARKRGAELSNGRGMVISGSCWDTYEIRGQLLIITRICIPQL